MFTAKNWYVVYTRPKCEKKVAGLLRTGHVEAYCPVVKERKQWSDRKKTIEEPLFPSYVFVCAALQDITLIKQVPGVVNLVYWMNKPAVVREEEIAAIKNFILDYKKITLEKAAVNINEKVRIISGPFMNKEGNVVEIKHKTIKVYLPSLGYNLVAEFEKSAIQLVKEERHSLVS
jgi:transcription antitermination factor NusG